MKTNILTLAITLTLGIILAGSLLMPVIADASTDEHTGTNPYKLRMSEIGEETITLTYDADTEKPLYNGELTNFTDSSGSAVNAAIVSDTFVIVTTGSLWYYYFIYEGSDVQIYSIATGATTAVATIGNGSMNLYISESTSYDLPYTFCYIPDNNGDHVVCEQSTYGLFKTSDDITVFKGNRTDHGVATGTVDTLTTDFHATDGTADTDTYTFNVVYDTETVGLTDLCKTPNDSYRYILPYEYHYLQDNDYSTLYSAIPVLVIVGLVLAATSVIIARRD